MMRKRVVFACTALLLAATVSPAMAHDWHFWHWGQHWGHGGHWRAVHGAIYASENRIAFLEADPEIDDGYKAPIITRAHADILRLRATLHPARWRWASPCCYGRRPIHIR